jgi:FkbM family methyltransferase
MLLNLETLVDKYQMKIQGVLHIGAHFGEENDIYDKLKIENRIFFEPLKSNYKVLQEKLQDKHPSYNVALGNENKNISMYVETANSGQSSSILKPSIHLKQYPHIQFNTMEEVEMFRLDDMKLNLEKFNFINIDVQGYELEVFKGAVKTLENIDFIMSEINRDEVYENCTKINELTDFLSDFGFDFVEQTWDGGTWGDGFFIKNKQK